MTTSTVQADTGLPPAPDSAVSSSNRAAPGLWSRVTANAGRLLIALELLIVIGVSVLGPRTVMQWGEAVRVRGQEFSYLVGSGAVADIVFDATGRIPLWNSWMGRGEPLVENSFSYINNPFLFLPVLAWGMIDGAKVAVVIHAVIAGLGGWLLAYVIGLRSGGRLLSACLFAGSGGLIGAIGMGFYQVGLSQAYVPWVYAGMIGTLRRRDRWSVGVLVMATSLLLFAGTFWYVLPTAIGCAAFIAFGILRRDAAGRLTVDREAVRRVAMATVLIVLVSATRLIPQAVHHGYVEHVEEFLPNPARDFGWTAGLYFSPTMPPDLQISSLFFFYAMSPLFLAIVLIGRVLIVPMSGKTPGTWRILLPSALLWLLFTSWGQEGGEMWVWLYNTIPLLREWRFVTRMLAAGIPFLILIAVICFDDLVEAAWRWMRISEPGTVGKLAGGLTALIILGVGSLAALDTLYNWQRESGVEPVGRDRSVYFYHERFTRPDDFIAVHEWDFYGYFDHYETLIRTGYGNPDYEPGGQTPTFGTVEMMEFEAPEAIEYHSDFARWLAGAGYIAQPLPANVPRATHWVNPSIPPYAYYAPATTFPTDRTDRLTAGEVTPAEYHYQMDTITVRLNAPEDGTIVVVTETAYPGWYVTIDGERAPLQSVGGLIGALVYTGERELVFTYRPGWLYGSSVVTLIGAVVFAAYLLRADRLVRRRRDPAA